MPNLAVEANILATLPPGTVRAEWMDLSGQLGDEFKPETSRIAKAVDKDGKATYHAGHEANGAKPFFLEIHLPEGTVATEPGSQSILRQDLIDALNQLAGRQ